MHRKHNTSTWLAVAEICWFHMHARMHARTHTTVLWPCWILSRTTRVSRHQKGKTNQDLLEQEIVSGSGIRWAICKSAPWPRHNKASIPPVSFIQARCPSCHPTNSVKALTELYILSSKYIAHHKQMLMQRYPSIVLLTWHRAAKYRPTISCNTWEKQNNLLNTTNTHKCNNKQLGSAATAREKLKTHKSSTCFHNKYDSCLSCAFSAQTESNRAVKRLCVSVCVHACVWVWQLVNH